MLNQKPLMPDHGMPIVVVGAGGIVKFAHLPAYRMAGFQVAGILDTRQEAAEVLAAEFGIPRVFGSLGEAVREHGRGVVYDVAVPAGAILEVLRELLDGAAVLIQKPMGETLEEAVAIARVCRDKGLKAAVNFQLRTAPYVLAARDLIAQGEIGEVLEVDVKVTVHTPWANWTFLEKSPRMEIVYHSIHYLDLIRCLLGEPRGVKANTIKHPASPKLHSSRSAMILDYGPDARAQVVTYHAHTYGPEHQESQVRIEGTKGCVMFQMGLNMNYPDGAEDWFEYSVAGSEGWTREELIGGWFPHAFVGTMASVMRWAEDEGQVPETWYGDALKTMQLVEAAYLDAEHPGTSYPDVRL